MTPVHFSDVSGDAWHAQYNAIIFDRGSLSVQRYRSPAGVAWPHLTAPWLRRCKRSVYNTTLLALVEAVGASQADFSGVSEQIEGVTAALPAPGTARGSQTVG